MAAKDRDHVVKPFPPLRRLMVDGGRLARQKHVIHGLAEVDVTQPRAILRVHRARTGESLSFTAFVIACLGRAIDANRHMHAYRNWRGQLVIHAEVDVNTLFDVEVEGRRVIATHILRAVNRKTVREIHAEIREFQASHQTSPESASIRRFVSLPAFLRRAFLWAMFKNPGWVKSTYGTVAVTSVGMFASGGFWGIPAPNHTLQVTLGGIAERPELIDGHLQAREYLSLTLSFDHDIIDGVPAAMFAQRLKELIESGFGLPDNHQPSPPRQE